jgi:hypothetical protein
LTPNEDYYVYVVPNTIINGESLGQNEIRSGPNLIITEFTGTFKHIKLFGPATNTGNYYVVLDYDNDGNYTSSIDIKTSLTISDITTEIEIIATDELGNFISVVGKEDPIFVKGNGFSPLENIHIYIIKEVVWLEDYMLLYDISGNGIEAAQADGSGQLGVTSIGSIDDDTTCDIVVDVDRNGVYTHGTDILTEGFGITIGDGGIHETLGSEWKMQLTVKQQGNSHVAHDRFDWNKGETLYIHSGVIGNSGQNIGIWIFPESSTPSDQDNMYDLIEDVGAIHHTYNLEGCGNIHYFQPWLRSKWIYSTTTDYYNVILNMDESTEGSNNVYTYDAGTDIIDGWVGNSGNGDTWGFSITDSSSNQLDLSEISENWDNSVANSQLTYTYVQADSSDYQLTANFSSIDSNYNQNNVFYCSYGNDGTDNDGDNNIDETDEQGIYRIAYSVSANNTKTDGNYTINYTFTDDNQNTLNKSINVSLDNTPSTANITEPSENAEVNGTIEIKVQSDLDSRISKLLYYYDEDDNNASDDGWNWNFINNVTYNSTNGSIREYIISWNTSALTNGSYIILAVVYDNANNQARDIVYVDVKN